LECDEAPLGIVALTFEELSWAVNCVPDSPLLELTDALCESEKHSRLGLAQVQKRNPSSFEASPVEVVTMMTKGFEVALIVITSRISESLPCKVLL
jgi:hypothetical protein